MIKEYFLKPLILLFDMFMILVVCYSTYTIYKYYQHEKYVLGVTKIAAEAFLTELDTTKILYEIEEGK